MYASYRFFRAPLVNSLTDAARKIIMLTGGFAQSPYIQRVLRDRVGRCVSCIEVVDCPM
jgi:sugar (pentulose or hexulose) kinase